MLSVSLLLIHYGGGQWHREITSERGRTVFEGEVMFVVFLNIL